jgi:hypothetical protein
MGAISGDVNTLSMHCVDAADLASRPIAGLQDGDLAYVESFRGYFSVDRLSTAAANGTTVITTPSGTGRWLRLINIIDPFWQQQAAWFINPTTGSDQNDGSTALTPLATWAEFRRRVQVINQDTTVTIASALPATDPLFGDFEGVPTAAGAVPFLTIEGTPTVLDSDVITTRADPVAATNSEGTLTSAGIPVWTVGAIVETTGGATPDAATVVMADAAGTAQVPFWAKGVALLTHPLPAIGDAIRMFNSMSTGASSAQLQLTNLTCVLRYLAFDMASARIAGETSTVLYYACQFASAIEAVGSGRVTFIGCAFNAGSSIRPSMAQGATIFGGGIRATQRFNNNAYVAFDGCISYASLIVGNDPTANAQGWAAARVTGSGLGVFNGAGPGITVGAGGRLDVENVASNPYGDGNTTTGLAVNDGGIVQIDSAVTPLIIGPAGQNLMIDGQATVVSPLTAADVAVPGAAALVTWADWTAVPFNRIAVNYAFTAANTGIVSQARVIGT